MNIRKMQKLHKIFGILAYVHATMSAPIKSESVMLEVRLKKIKDNIKKEKLDAILVSSIPNISYLTGYSNFSVKEREAYLLIGQDFQYIITDGRYAEAVKKQVPFFTLFERRPNNLTEKLFKKLKSQIKAFGIEEDNLTVLEYKLIKKHFKNTKHFEINTQRSIKSDEEIKKIEKACNIGDLAFDYILQKIKVGVSEKQIAFKLEHFIKQQNCDLSFSSIVAFNKNSSIPHHHTGNTILGPKSSLGLEGQFVLLDFGVKVDGYCSDMTRTIFFGKPTKEQKDIYEIVLTAQQKAVEFINTSIKSGKQIKAYQADKAARDYILSKGYPSIPHSLGHGIGLEVHEHPYISPKSDDVLKEGMIFSIEPGIYQPGFGGVRIEDLYIVEKNGLRQLTTSLKKLITV